MDTPITAAPVDAPSEVKTPPKGHDFHSGDHSHTHDHMDGYSHEHAHSHTNDNMHDHPHAHAQNRSIENNDDHTHEHEEEENPVLGRDNFSVYLPITRIDNTERLVTGQATVEKPDAYGTIFAYYPEAWTAWRGNMREQHDPKKAVGKAIEVIPNAEERAIYITSKVSRGAQDTWLKIEDGVLSGYSASIIPDPEFGVHPKNWPTKEYNGKSYPYLPRYSVAETSYVDNPATPGCNISIVRSDGFLTDVIEVSEEQKPIERAGAKISGDTMSKMHDSIGHTLKAAVSQMKNCNCPTCQKVMRVVDPDADGDVDMGGFDDPDKDANTMGAVATQRYLEGIIERAIAPAYMRLQVLATNLAKIDVQKHPSIIDTTSLDRVIKELDAKLLELPTKANFDEIRTELSVVKDQVVKIGNTPMPGGPVMNASVTEKKLPTDPQQVTPRENYGSVYEAIRNLSQSGELNSTDKQVAAGAALLQAQRRR